MITKKQADEIGMSESSDVEISGLALEDALKLLRALRKMEVDTVKVRTADGDYTLIEYGKRLQREFWQLN